MLLLSIFFLLLKVRHA